MTSDWIIYIDEMVLRESDYAYEDGRVYVNVHEFVNANVIGVWAPYESTVSYGVTIAHPQENPRP